MRNDEQGMLNTVRLAFFPPGKRSRAGVHYSSFIIHHSLFIIHHSSEGMPEGFFDLDLLVFAEHAQEHDRVLETFEIQVHE